MNPTYKESEAGEALNIYLNSELIEEGKPFIDIQAKTIGGKEFKLSHLLGRTILLIFGMTGCSAARRLNRYMKANQINISPNIEIVSFFTGNNRNTWEKVSKEDDINWTNISTLEGNKGKIKALYDIHAAPTVFYIKKN